jgi:hypothetical protein
MNTRLFLLASFVALSACGGGGPDKGACPFPGTCTASSGGGSAPAPLPGFDGFTQRGTGPSVFTLPASVTTVRIEGTTTSSVENFAVRASGRLIVNEVIGTTQTPTGHAGTYSVPAGALIEVFNATNVTWVVTAATATPVQPGTFSRQGDGAAVFDLPQRTARYRLTATFSGTAENFAVRIGQDLVVNAVIGSSRTPPTFDGIYSLSGGRVEVLAGTGVSWSFTELP